jgi:PAS domain S-box-containing protein
MNDQTSRTPGRPTPELQAEIALAAARGLHTPAELGARYGIDPLEVERLRQQLIGTASRLFAASPEPKDAERERLEVIARCTSDPLALVDRAGRLLWANQLMSESLGYVPEDLRSLTTEDVCPDLTFERFSVLFDEARSRRVARFEGLFRRRDGTTFPVEISATIVTLADGMRLFIAGRDATERKRVEQALRDSEGRLRHVLDAAELGVWEHDLRTGTIHLDVRAQAAYGMAADASLDDVSARIHADDVSRVVREIGAAIDPAQRAPVSTEYRVVHADGSWRWLRVQGRVEFAGDDVGAEPLRGRGTVQDITDRKCADSALRDSELRYRTLFDSMAEGFCVLEMVYDEAGRAVDYRFVETNAAFGRHTGLVGADGRTARELVPELEQHWVDVYGRVAETGESHFFVLGSDAMGRWFEVEAFRVGDPANRRVALLFADISERRAAEESLRQLTATLEERVAERTHEAQELARRLTIAEQEERRRIAQILHDDLQQLLYGVQLKITMVQRTLAQMPSAPLVQESAQALSWLGQAVDVTRQLTVDLNPPILKNEGLTASLEWLQRQMRELHGLDVEVVAADPFQMQDEGLRVLLFQSVRELLFNIKKHAGVQHARVELAGEPNQQIVIRVTDQGNGFEASRSEQEQTFGLYNIRERLRLIGGDMVVESTPAKGTCVTLRAPLGHGTGA